MGFRLGGAARSARQFAPTAAVNLIAVACGAASGLLVARFLGPGGRGDYTAVTAWFGLVLLVAELGQTSAVVYFVSRERERGEDWLRTSRWLMAILGVPFAVAGLVLAPMLADDPDVVLGYRLLFAVVPLAMISGSSMASLQARRIKYWNIGRLVSPVTTLAITGLLCATSQLTFLRAVGAYVVSLVGQAVVIGTLSRRVMPRGGSFRWESIRPLVRYGIAQLASRVPTAVNGYADKILLSQVVSAEELGEYAVAVAFTVLILPVSSAIGAVSMPRIASHSMTEHGRHRMVRTALGVCVVTSVAATVPIVALAGVYVPLVVGSQYADSVKLIWILGPGSVFLAVSQVQGDILRGLGRPMVIARAQGVASIATILLLATLVPRWGAVGAAVASTVAYATACLFLAPKVRRLTGSDAPPPERPGEDDL